MKWPASRASGGRPTEAIRWFRKAAEQNCADAQLNLAALYLNGVGVKQDLTTARQWAVKARPVRRKEADDVLAQIEKALAETRTSSIANE